MRSWVGPIHWPPWSIGVPSAAGSVSVRPPTRSRASSTTASAPAATRSRAATSPASPAPTTTTSVAAVTDLSSPGGGRDLRAPAFASASGEHGLASRRAGFGAVLYEVAAPDRQRPFTASGQSVYSRRHGSHRRPGARHRRRDLRLDQPGQRRARRDLPGGRARAGRRGRVAGSPGGRVVGRARLRRAPAAAAGLQGAAGPPLRRAGRPGPPRERQAGRRRLRRGAAGRRAPGRRRRRAACVLRPRRAASTLLLANHSASVEYQPLGVVGVIGPWNYPVYTPTGAIASALAAGNAVVFKPSELTPAVGRLLADAFAEVVPEQPVLQVVTGDGTTGNALCLAGVDKVSFTGSPATGRKVMAACAERLTPVVLELGGKDAMIVDEDGDVDAAAEQAVWGGMANAGQTCLAIERVYVVDRVYDRFVDRVVELAARVRPGADADADIGPITLPRQLEVIRRQLADAFERGARALVGGPDAVRPPYVDPVVLVDVPEDALVMREETFGPVLPVVRVRDADEAVERANASAYGLGGAVFARRRADHIARALRSRMTSVNSVLTFARMPSLPFGGVGESGFGRVHGPDGLREFSRAKAITRQRFPLPFSMLSFDRPARLLPAVERAMKLRHARRPRT